MTGIFEKLVQLFEEIILPYSKEFYPLAASIFIILVTLIILKEAINISSGKGINLASKLILIFIIGTLLLGYGNVSKKIYSSAKITGQKMIPNFKTMIKTIEDGYSDGQKRHWAMLKEKDDGVGLITQAFLFLVMALLSGIGFLVIFLTIAMTLVFVAGAYASLAMVLVIGPVFIAMLLMEEVRSIGIRWIVIMISYFLAIAVYGIVIKVILEIYSKNIYFDGSDPRIFGATMSLTATVEQIGILTIGPLISFGLVFSVSKIVERVMGSAGNIAEETTKAIMTVATFAIGATRGFGLAKAAAAKGAGKSMGGIAPMGTPASGGSGGIVSSSVSQNFKDSGSNSGSGGGGITSGKNYGNDSGGGKPSHNKSQGFSFADINPPNIVKNSGGDYSQGKIKESLKNLETEHKTKGSDESKNNTIEKNDFHENKKLHEKVNPEEKQRISIQSFGGDKKDDEREDI